MLYSDKIGGRSVVNTAKNIVTLIDYTCAIDESARAIVNITCAIVNITCAIDESARAIDESARAIDESARAIDESACVIDESACVIVNCTRDIDDCIVEYQGGNVIVAKRDWISDLGMRISDYMCVNPKSKISNRIALLHSRVSALL